MESIHNTLILLQFEVVCCMQISAKCTSVKIIYKDLEFE